MNQPFKFVAFLSSLGYDRAEFFSGVRTYLGVGAYNLLFERSGLRFAFCVHFRWGKIWLEDYIDDFVLGVDGMPGVIHVHVW